MVIVDLPPNRKPRVVTRDYPPAPQAVLTCAATRGLISHQTSAAEIEIGRRFAGIIVIGLARWLTGNLEDS